MKLKWKASLLTAVMAGAVVVSANFHAPRAEASSYSFVSSFFDAILKFKEQADKQAGSILPVIPAAKPEQANPGNSQGQNPNKPENPGNSQGQNPNKPENPGNSQGQNPNKPENPGNSQGQNPNKPENPGNGQPKPPKVDEKAVKLILKETEQKLVQLKNSTQSTLMALAFQFAFAQTTHEKTVLYQQGKDALAASIASFAVIMKDAAQKLAALGADVSQLDVYQTAFDTFQVQGKAILKQIVD